MTTLGVIILGLIALFWWGIMTGGISNLEGSAHKGEDETNDGGK